MRSATEHLEPSPAFNQSEIATLTRAVRKLQAELGWTENELSRMEAQREALTARCEALTARREALTASVALVDEILVLLSKREAELATREFVTKMDKLTDRLIHRRGDPQ